VNEFIEQFIVESREHIEQASSGLLALERAPTDAQMLDSVFRAFHTLKGGASIVEFAAMERAVHAAEDVLSRARSGQQPLTREQVESCLACVDQVAHWLDRMEASGELPVHADDAARAVADRIQRAARLPANDPPPNLIRSAAWADAILNSNPDLRAQARTAIRFTPASASFFEGQDPLRVLAGVPKLLWIDAEPVDSWPALHQLDPFESILVLTAMSAAIPDEVRASLSDHAAQCDIVALQPGAATAAKDEWPASARKLLEAQLRLLDHADTLSFAGTVEAAGAVVANVLRACGHTSRAEVIAAATRDGLRERDAHALRQQIAEALTIERPLADDSVESMLHRENAVLRSLRVDAERVDSLVRLTGEFTVIKNAIGHVLTLAQQDVSTLIGTLRKHHGALDHLVAELHGAVLALRVVPLRTVFQRFPRMVRETAATLDKPVQLVLEGEETEVDKVIAETLFEPLLHIVRNAIDHGIESSELRRRSGKPALGTIRMRASRQGANVHIEVVDDGGGIDVARLREIARQRGGDNGENFDSMADSSIIDLVFAAGVSTASTVTALSGRGIGMDAVRAAVERVGGRVAIASRRGEGTTVTLTLPFSVMMTHVMTVEAGGQVFGIPLDAVVETIRVPAEAITGVGAAKALVHRDRTLPILDLAGVLGVGEVGCDQSEAIVVVATVAGEPGGIQVDRLGERMEVMLKPPEGLLTGLPGLAGTTILGDGRVLLVLDLSGVLQ
jgi:two-component system chemotaxis sensor kinase CheA